MSSGLSDSRLRDLYHVILEEEARRVSNTPPNEKISGRSFSLLKTQYYLSYDELKALAMRIGLKDTDAEKYINELRDKGFLIPVDIKNNKFRSYHFDFLLRVSDLRTAPWTNKMTSEVRFVVGTQEFEDFTQASLIPSPQGEELEREFYHMLRDKLEEFADLYIKILREYLKLRNSNGLTYFQLKALLAALKNFKDIKAIMIAAPAGFGKTEIFLGILLFKLLKDLKDGRKSRMLIVYPRKFLEIDQAYRLIEFVRIINSHISNRGCKISISIRDGDSYKIEDDIEKHMRDINYEVPFRGIKCRQEGTLHIRIKNRNTEVVCKEGFLTYDYNFVKWSRYDSKRSEIIITNLYTLFNRFISASDQDLDVRDLIASDLPLEMLILDEAHEYEPVELGLLHYIIKFFDKRKKGESLKLIISTATLANAKGFATELRGVTEKDVLVIEYNDIMEQGRDEIEKLKNNGKLAIAKKFIIFGIIFVHPMYSWETYTGYLAIANLFTNYILSLAFGSKALKQAIIFLNNVKELNRLYTIIDNELNLGTPIDFTSFTAKILSTDLDPIVNRYSLKHYSDILEQFSKTNNEIKQIVDNIKSKQQMKEELFPKLTKVFAEVDLDERREISLKIHNKSIYTIIATSSLELGVDYPGVTVIANVGLDRLPSLIQRFGRAGRNPKETLNTVLALLIIRNNPVEYVRMLKILESTNLEALITGKLKDINNKDIIEEFIIDVGKHLIGVKKLAASRILFALSALDPIFQDLHGFAVIETQNYYRDVCSKLVRLRNILHKYNNEIERILDEKSVNELLQEIFRYSDVTQCIHALQNEEKIESYIDHVATVIEEINDLCKDISNLNIVVPNIDVPRQRCKDLYTRYKEKVKILVARFSIEDKEQELRGLLGDMNKDLKEYCQLLWDSTREVEKFDNKIIEPLSRCNNINNRVVELSNNIGLKK